MKRKWNKTPHRSAASLSHKRTDKGAHNIEGKMTRGIKEEIRQVVKSQCIVVKSQKDKEDGQSIKLRGLPAGIVVRRRGSRRFRYIGRTTFTLSLGARGIFTVVPGGVGGFTLRLAGGRRLFLIFLGLLEQLLLALVGNHLGSISKDDDPARAEATEPTGSVKVHLIVVRVCHESIPIARATEFSCPRQSVGIGGRGFLERLAVLGRRTRAVPVRNPLCNLVVPLVLGPAVQKADNYHGHVVASDTTGFAVRRETVVHHVLTDAMEVLLGGNTSPDKFDDLLRRLTIPDTYMTRQMC